MSSNRRIVWIDTAKGLLILFVILGHAHVHTYVDVAINTFHMCGFFLLSGYTFRANQDFKRFLGKQVRGLLLPYAIFSAVFLAVEAAKAYLLHIGSFNLYSGIISFFLPVSGRQSTSVYTMWFFPCLFMVKMVAYGLARAWHYKRCVALVCCAALMGACVLFNVYSGVISVISILPIATLFFVCGLGFKEIERRFSTRTWVISSCLVYVVSVTFNVLLKGTSFDLSSMTLGIWPLYILSSLSGTIALLFLARRLASIKLLYQIGIDSRYYYGLHFEVLSLVSHVLRITKGWYSLIAALITVGVLYVFCWIKRKVTA